jgi:hypothetical protein
VASGGDQDIGQDTTNRNGTFRLGFLNILFCFQAAAQLGLTRCFVQSNLRLGLFPHSFSSHSWDNAFSPYLGQA